MASKENAIAMVDAHQLASVIRGSGARFDKVLIVDSRSFLEYNDMHILGAVNVCCSKLVKRRLQQDKVCVRDFLLHNCHLERRAVEESGDVIVYDQSSVSAALVSPDSFLCVLLHKLVHVFRRVFLLSGGFLEFQACYGDLCEDKSRLMRSSTLNMTSLSQPCLPITNVGPTRILPFLYLGSQQDAHNHELLTDYNITYEVNVSTNCPKPDFIADSHFLRLPVNDSHGEKLLPYFNRATQFIDKVRETNGSVLVHCLAGISRSPTVAIAYVMRHLKMTFDDAFRYVKSKRTSISPNFNFLGQLLEYERQLRAEEVLDSSVGDISCLPPASASVRVPLTSNNSPVVLATAAAATTTTTTMTGRERLSRSVSLSLSLKSPALETVPHSCSPSPDAPFASPFVFRAAAAAAAEPATTPSTAAAADETDTGSSSSGSTLTVRGPLTSDLSPTTALARLTFEAMDVQPSSSSSVEEEIKEWSSAFIYSRGKHVRKESCRSLRKLLSSGSSSSTESHFFSSSSSKQKTTETSTTSTTTSSRSSMVLTVSQSKRVTSTSSPPAGSAAAAAAARARWKERDDCSPPPPPPSSLCSEISVRIEESSTTTTPDEGCEVEMRRRGPGYQRPHSDILFRPHAPLAQHHSTPTPTPTPTAPHAPVQHTRSVPRRPSYAPSEASSTFSDEMLLPPTPSSPPPSHCLLSPQTWGVGLYARSDSVTTSGLGSEISDTDTRADCDAFSLCSGSARSVLDASSRSCAGVGGGVDLETDSLPPDDGVFTEPVAPVRLQPPPARSTRPRPSSLLGIIPAKDLEWRPSCNAPQECVTWPFSTSPVPSLRKARPTSLTVSSMTASSSSSSADVVPVASSSAAAAAAASPLLPPSGATPDDQASQDPDDQLPDSATVFRLWRQREAAMEQQDRSESGPSRRRSKELTPLAVGRFHSGTSPMSACPLLPNCVTAAAAAAAAAATVAPETSSKRKSSEMPDESTSPPAVVEKRRSTRDGLDVLDRSFSSDDGSLYRVKSCPDMVDQVMSDDDVLLPGTIQLELELNGKGAQHVQLRVRSSQSRRNSQTQRFSCGALDGQAAKCPDGEAQSACKGSPSCGSAQNSNTSLNCSSFSIIEVS